MQACGWYLCAALHSDPLETWLARRLVGVNEDSVLDMPKQMAQVKQNRFVDKQTYICHHLTLIIKKIVRLCTNQ